MSYKFYGGVYPPTFKSLTADKPVNRTFIPKRVIIPLAQHVGAPAQPIVAVGDKVKIGQPIATASGLISSPAHASISGKITKIAPTPTPTSPRVIAITIEAEDEEQLFKTRFLKDVEKLSKEELLQIIKEAGIVGLGGAAFPTHVKLSPPKGKRIDSFILNGVECEPYLTCDYRLMLERAEEILKGVELIAKVLDVKNVYIAIEDNKLLAIQAMEKAVENIQRKIRVRIVALKTKYPQGAEKQVIKAILNRTVPAGALPLDVGCVVQNVQTALAIYEAVYLSKPLIERTVTLSGFCLKEPINTLVRIGTLLCDLLDYCGGFSKEPKRIIFGGPMMGIAHFSLEIPITKGTSGIVFLTEEEIDQLQEDVCIRCGKCVEVCPMGLAPTAIMYRVKKERFQEAKDLGVVNCFECGACAYICPAKIALLDYMKWGKSKL